MNVLIRLGRGDVRGVGEGSGNSLSELTTKLVDEASVEVLRSLVCEKGEDGVVGSSREVDVDERARSSDETLQPSGSAAVLLQPEV